MIPHRHLTAADRKYRTLSSLVNSSEGVTAKSDKFANSTTPREKEKKGSDIFHESSSSLVLIPCQ
ncbi:hypothetical protein OUZ56_011013 [Daphnia magna]|uniref:Uncharacterized protein n=1 Tax=Daphnia magna TaxID=35525 RepID=A0ABQ9YZ71_9CRUS|nr:hypothetical protein OUZ56_011013 [Daphnia magna]